MERNMSEEISYVEELSPIEDGRGPLALALGLAAALAAGGLWAALVMVTNLEIGYAAVGVGLLVGMAMSRVTAQRTRQLAYAAAAFAVIGLIAGKAFIFAASSGAVAEDLAGDEEVMRSAVAWQMYADRSLDEVTLDAVDRSQAGVDTLSDAAWESMLQQAAVTLAAMTDEERREVATATARGFMRSVGVVGGIRAQLTFFDLLWAFLAVGAAYRMLAPARKETAVEMQQA
jgi:hypothetical protein